MIIIDNDNKIKIINEMELYHLYNDWLIDHDLGINQMTKNEIKTAEYIRDEYRSIYKKFKNKKIKLEAFERKIKKIMEG